MYQQKDKAHDVLTANCWGLAAASAVAAVDSKPSSPLETSRHTDNHRSMTAPAQGAASRVTAPTLSGCYITGYGTAPNSARLRDRQVLDCDVYWSLLAVDPTLERDTSQW